MLYSDKSCYNSTYWVNIQSIGMLLFLIFLISIIALIIYKLILKKKSKKIKLILSILACVCLVSFIGINVYLAIERPPSDHYCWSSR